MNEPNISIKHRDCHMYWHGACSHKAALEYESSISSLGCEAMMADLELDPLGQVHCWSPQESKVLTSAPFHGKAISLQHRWSLPRYEGKIPDFTALPFLPIHFGLSSLFLLSLAFSSSSKGTVRYQIVHTSVSVRERTWEIYRPYCKCFSLVGRVLGTPADLRVRSSGVWELCPFLS